MAGSEGATINNLIFNVDLAIMNGAAVNNVTVTQCTFNNPVQAISNWRGSGWEISHNTIKDLRCKNGGGIGILVGDYMGGVVKDNLISHNNISGTLHVLEGDKGGYSGSGIVLFADFRYGYPGANDLTNNFITKNKIGMVSDNPILVDIFALELTDTRDDEDEGCKTIFANSIGFNDFRGTLNQIALTPGNLDTCNNLSRNFGENRGRGLHPSVFKPGKN